MLNDYIFLVVKQSTDEISAENTRIIPIRKVDVEKHTETLTMLINKLEEEYCLIYTTKDLKVQEGLFILEDENYYKEFEDNIFSIDLLTDDVYETMREFLDNYLYIDLDSLWVVEIFFSNRIKEIEADVKIAYNELTN